ncbi:M20 family metallopeptidase [Saxibacter everestensis]|uniref:Peptidase M20 domain-containing protein 2 n=1 Tax=Saxibacter everestensis TaxID=2909229 RepID=A0ABY8QP64_9MICO|nr:M20 family metallopeptidase [Brevibacteriaceae bacterium ZFBP1038]
MSSPDPVNRAYLNHLDADTRRLAAEAEPPGSKFAGAGEALISAVNADIDEHAEDLRRLVQSLHQNPETAFEEHRSAAEIVALLNSYDVHAERGVYGLETAIRAEVGSGGPAIAILSEYDALPEVGHACGHNVIAATGVGAFLSLVRLARSRPDALPGRVVFLGTPAEEGNSGKEYMAAAGAFDDVDAAIMVHPYGYDVAEQVWLGRRLLRVTFSGTAAHASAQPFMGRNALDAASLAYQAVGVLRQQILPVDRIHAIITEGGSRPSVIPESAIMEFYVRSKYPETLKALSERLNKIVEGAAMMTGTGCTIEWDDKPPSLPVRTNRALAGRWTIAQQSRGRSPLPLGVVSETIAASTDFGNVSFRIPGIHPLIKIAEPDVALHTRDFADAAGSQAAELGAIDGASGLACTALDYLCDEALRNAVHEEFEASGGAIDVPHYFD